MLLLTAGKFVEYSKLDPIRVKTPNNHICLPRTCTTIFTARIPSIQLLGTWTLIPKLNPIDPHISLERDRSIGDLDPRGEARNLALRLRFTPAALFRGHRVYIGKFDRDILGSYRDSGLGLRVKGLGLF